MINRDTVPLILMYIFIQWLSKYIYTWYTQNNDLRWSKFGVSFHHAVSGGSLGEKRPAGRPEPIGQCVLPLVPPRYETQQFPYGRPILQGLPFGASDPKVQLDQGP